MKLCSILSSPVVAALGMPFVLIYRFAHYNTIPAPLEAVSLPISSVAPKSETVDFRRKGQDDNIGGVDKKAA